MTTAPVGLLVTTSRAAAGAPRLAAGLAGVTAVDTASRVRADTWLTGGTGVGVEADFNATTAEFGVAARFAAAAPGADTRAGADTGGGVTPVLGATGAKPADVAVAGVGACFGAIGPATWEGGDDTVTTGGGGVRSSRAHRTPKTAVIPATSNHTAASAAS